jgi:hypothetical protein
MDENLRLQYTEINVRSRWYASQAWQVPFAYIALIGLMAGGFKDDKEALSLVLSISASIGTIVVIHLLFISWRISELVKDLNNIEKELGQPGKSKNIWGIHGSMLVFLVVALCVVYLASCYIVTPTA